MKLTSVLVQLDAPMRYLPSDVQHALDRFLFHWCKGMDPQHDASWRRMWRRLFHSKEQRPSLCLFVDVERSRPFHARWMAIEQRLYSMQDGFYNLGGFRTWIKAGAAFGHYEATAAGLQFVPSSLSYEDCSDEEFRQFADDALAFLRTPHALETLWPLVAEKDREEMLDAALIDPNQETAQ